MPLLPYLTAAFVSFEKQEATTARFETVCFDCPDWDECGDCTIERGGVTPTCESPLEHTTASEPGVTMETLRIDKGYRRATNTSDNILACYNADACTGGVTGAEGYCASGYTGPCEGERYVMEIVALPLYRTVELLCIVDLVPYLIFVGSDAIV